MSLTGTFKGVLTHTVLWDFQHKVMVDAQTKKLPKRRYLWELKSSNTNITLDNKPPQNYGYQYYWDGLVTEQLFYGYSKGQVGSIHCTWWLTHMYLPEQSEKSKKVKHAPKFHTMTWWWYQVFVRHVKKILHENQSVTQLNESVYVITGIIWNHIL